MIVVSDAGPLIYLGSVGRLALLRDLFGRVVVPQQVWNEVVGTGIERPGSAAVAAASWIDVRTPAQSLLTERLLRLLDAGEASNLRDARPGGNLVEFDDRVGFSAVVIESRYPQAHMKGRRGRVLCLFDKRTRTPFVSDADSLLRKRDP